MRRKVLIRGLAVMMLTSIVLTVVIYTTKNKVDEKKTSDLALWLNKVKSEEKGVVAGDSVKIKKNPKTEPDTSKVKLDNDEDKDIKDITKNNAKLIKNMKRLFAEFNVDKASRKEIITLAKSGYSIQDILAAFDFLSDENGKITELKTLLDMKKDKSDWSDAFDAYKKLYREFVPTNFENGYLDKLLSGGIITQDDVVIADILSQKEYGKFNEFIDKRKQGKKWAEIKKSIGVINVKEKLDGVPISGDQLQTYIKDTGLKTKEVLDAVVLADKMGLDEKDTLNKVKKGTKKEKLRADKLKEKYNKD